MAHPHPNLTKRKRVVYNKPMQHRGFTIVELLIVIVIIAILAAITIVSYNGITQRAQATSIASDMRATIKAFNLYKETIGATTWPADADTQWNGTTSGNPSVSSIISYNATFRDFLQKAPQTTGLSTSTAWFFDNDNDNHTACTASVTGVSLILASVTNTALAQAIDSAIDDGNLSCGSVWMSGSYLVFGISNTP